MYILPPYLKRLIMLTQSLLHQVFVHSPSLSLSLSETARQKMPNKLRPSVSRLKIGRTCSHTHDSAGLILCIHIIQHRRRIKTAAKAKVVAAVWGTVFIQFLAALAIVH